MRSPSPRYFISSDGQAHDFYHHLITNTEKLRKLNQEKQDDRFFNRELSWLEFNHRVLQESCRSRSPLLERSKFLAICYANLDEFFMVRVANKKKALRQVTLPSDSPDRRSIVETLLLIRTRTKELVADICKTWNSMLQPALDAVGISLFMQVKQLPEVQQKALLNCYKQTILPVLTPLAVDPAHPFPFLANRRLYLLVLFDRVHKDKGLPPIAFVEVPNVLPRLVLIEKNVDKCSYVWLESLIAAHLSTLFFDMPILDAYPIRVTRNVDFKLMESQVDDLMSSVQFEVKARDHAEAVRLEYSASLPQDLLIYLTQRLGLSADDAYSYDCPLALFDLLALYELPREDLKFAPFNPRLPPLMKSQRDIFDLISEKDLLLHHPYESFYAVIELIHSAVWDPDVLAIKQTLYRSSGDSPIIDALIMAAEQGKQVTAVVELKARFDEHNNITWARRMERAGVHVVYGFVGLKTHCKITLIIRREAQQLHRYVHLSTGNYNSSTARQYVDIGYITKRLEFGEDASLLFNLLTGFNILSRDTTLFNPDPSPLLKLLVAPLYLRSALVRLIDREIFNQSNGGRGYIMAKMNSLVDGVLIDKLYEASQAGVQIRLIVRGTCCLRPNIEGLSKGIEVISIIGRFLEHSRICYFLNGGAEEVYLGSADWMPRNMDRRIEVLFPIEDFDAKRRVIDEILPTYWADTENAWLLQANGQYIRYQSDDRLTLDSQEKFIALAREQGIKSLPYEKAIRYNLKLKGRPVVKKGRSKKPALGKE